MITKIWLLRLNNIVRDAISHIMTESIWSEHVVIINKSSAIVTKFSFIMVATQSILVIIFNILWLLPNNKQIDQIYLAVITRHVWILLRRVHSQTNDNYGQVAQLAMTIPRSKNNQSLWGKQLSVGIIIIITIMKGQAMEQFSHFIRISIVFFSN